VLHSFVSQHGRLRDVRPLHRNMISPLPFHATEYLFLSTAWKGRSVTPPTGYIGCSKCRFRVPPNARAGVGGCMLPPTSSQAASFKNPLSLSVVSTCRVEAPCCTEFDAESSLRAVEGFLPMLASVASAASMEEVLGSVGSLKGPVRDIGRRERKWQTFSSSAGRQHIVCCFALLLLLSLLNPTQGSCH
jgi:hypothetical protein